MLLPLSWLKEFLPTLPSTERLAEVLAMHGLEVESIIDRRKSFDRVVVGTIVGIKPHPNADKLQLADVVVTPNGKPIAIVCGAPNIAVGQKVPVAMLGAKLSNGLTIERRPIRGVESNGMLCAEDELGLGTNHAGILILDPATKVGAPFSKAMGFDDVVFDLAIPANRSDLMSVRGLAREIAAMLGKTAKIPAARKLKIAVAKKKVSVSVQSKKLCPIYTGQVIRGVSVKPSPVWLQNRLRQAGMRPINAIVDATNYVMLEYGQPLHAFDAANVAGGKIIVRGAKAGESLKTLDEKVRKLNPEMLVIADPQGPIALAGVMGGEASEVAKNTTNVVLESAIFDPVSIRRTSRKLGLISEASKRFEKGLPKSLPAEASQAATALIIALCGGVAEGKLVSVGTEKKKSQIIRFNPAYVSERLGMKVPAAKVRAILNPLGYKITGGKTWKVAVPDWRLDVTLPEDLVDEAGRMVGYEHLPSVMPITASIPRPLMRIPGLKQKISNTLIGLGFTEIISHAYYSDQWANKFGGPGKHFQVANPLDKTQQYLRRSSVPQVDEVLFRTVDAGKDARVFEVGRIFLPENGKVLDDQQPWSLSLGIAFVPPKGYAVGRKLRGYLEELFHAFGIRARENIIVQHETVKGRTVEWWSIDDIDNLGDDSSRRYNETSKFPAVTRDISFWFPESQPYGNLESKILQTGKPLLSKMTLDDVFIQDKKRSLKIRLTFQSPDRTLTKDEVDGVMAKIAKTIIELGGQIR